MDFSKAEQNGYIKGFVLFWLQYDINKHTEKEIYMTAQKLLQGCKEHFCAEVTQISHINAIVSPDKSDIFVQRAVVLVLALSYNEFVECAQLIVR
jgi:hypothetical protein